MNEPILQLKGLSKTYRDGALQGGEPLRAVQKIDLSVREGETFGIVGESGCGKTTLARLIMRLEAPTAGEILYRGERIDQLSEQALRPYRTRCQMVFQDSGSSLNPRKRVGDLLMEPMRFHHIVPEKQLRNRAAELLEKVGLSAETMQRYPHEFSGGQRQRICIARALSLNPELVVLDEPVSALDVSVQAQVLNLLRDLQAELGLTYLFIGHGLGAVHYLSHRIAVMYLGRFVELGDSEEVFNHPAHPYTRALLDAAPVADDARRDRPRLMLRGEIGHPAKTGCPLYERCPLATEDCRRISPELAELTGRAGHMAACDRALGFEEVKARG